MKTNFSVNHQLKGCSKKNIIQVLMERIRQMLLSKGGKKREKHLQRDRIENHFQASEQQNCHHNHRQYDVSDISLARKTSKERWYERVSHHRKRIEQVEVRG